MEFNSETEKKILTAAGEIFLEKGHAGARMQEIADRAGINKALLHYYFRSKDKLFHIVFRREMQIMLDNVFSSWIAVIKSSVETSKTHLDKNL